MTNEITSFYRCRFVRVASIYLFQYSILMYIECNGNEVILHDKSTERWNQCTWELIECDAVFILMLHCRAQSQKIDTTLQFIIFLHSTFITVIVFIVQSINVRIDSEKKPQALLNHYFTQVCQREWRKTANSKTHNARREKKKRHGDQTIKLDNYISQYRRCN